MRHSIWYALSTVSAAALFSSAAAAQVAGAPVESTPAETAEDQTPIATETVNAEGEPVSEGAIVVTGSRIRRSTYNTSSPVDVLTREDTLLAGERSTAEALQNSTITSGSAQISPTFLGFVSEGGPAANTVGLRGLGAARTLVLLNGRRLAPAGAGPELIAADLNVLPTAVVQRIEVLREGASSVYGSDAVAGVINILTDTKLNGLTLDLYTQQPIEHGGGGRTYRGSAVWGKSFDRGHVLASVEYRQTSGLKLGDREEFRCPSDLWTNSATGAPAGHYEADGVTPRCFPFQYEVLGTPQGYIFGQNFVTGAVNRWVYVNGSNSQLSNVNNFALRPLALAAREFDVHVYSPIRTITGYLNGAYDLNPDSETELYGEALFTTRRSRQKGTQQVTANGLGRSLYGGTFLGYTWEELRDLTGNEDYFTFPFIPNSLVATGAQAGRFFIMTPNTTSRQRVNFLRTNVGVRGNLGIGDLRWDANLQWSQTKSRYSIEQIRASKIDAALRPVLAPAGTPDHLVTVGLPGTPGAGNRYTCAINLDQGGNLLPDAECVPFDPFSPSAVAGNIPQGQLDWLFDIHTGRTTFRQATASAIVDGSILTLPGGPLAFAVGAEYRRDYIRDVPSEAAIENDLYNFSSAGITAGRDRVFELFGELEAPLLRDRPFFHDLSVRASARWTTYRSYGSTTTYRLGAQWAPVAPVRFRGSYGTAFRAPNLYEQFVADQSGFYPAGADPCDDFASKSAPGQPLYDNCFSQVGDFLNQDTDGDGTFDNWVATGGPQVITQGGRDRIKAETSRSFGFGVVITAPERIADLSLAIDYFNVRVDDQVSLLNTSILDFCYEADDFPNNQYCELIQPREQVQGTLTSFLNPYINIAQQKATGIDFAARYGTDLLGGKFVANLRATRNLKQIIQNFPDEAPFDYNGLLGYQGTTGGPKWVGDLDLRYTRGPWTFRWGVEYVGVMDTTDEVDPPVLANGQQVDYDLRAGAYFEHGVSIRYSWEKVGQITLGVNNLFNRNPPIISSHSDSAGQFPRIGNFFNYSGYDFLGRKVFLNITRSF